VFGLQLKLEVKSNRGDMTRMRVLAIKTFLITLGLVGTCQPSIAQNKETAEDVLRQVVSALGTNDQAALSKLSIDQSEFKKYMWPVLAVNMSGSNTSADKYYPTFQKVSQVGVDEAKSALAGKNWAVVKVSLEPPQRKGKGFQILGPPLITLRDEGGQEKTSRLVGGLLEREGVYRVTSYYVSPSQRASK